MCYWANGTTVRSNNEYLGDRRILKQTHNNIQYETLSSKGTMLRRSCLPLTWKRWCRENSAFVIVTTHLRKPRRIH